MQRSTGRVSVLVVGDVMLDEYVTGEVHRTSPEAPGVPVLRVTGRDTRLGGAANVAHNVARLGGRVQLVGVRGEDRAGEEIANLLSEAGIEDLLITVRKRQTTSKVRVSNKGQQIVRVDDEDDGPLPASARRQLLTHIAASEADFAIISDYAKGVLSATLIRALVKRFGAGNVLADIKPVHAPLVRGLRLITPNHAEAVAMLGSDPGEDIALAEQLSRKMGSGVGVTLGRRGSAICEFGGMGSLVDPHEVEEVEVSGAGDTYTAAIAVALARGESLEEAAHEANVAAALAVSKAGTATVSRTEVHKHSRR